MKVGLKGKSNHIPWRQYLDLLDAQADEWDEFFAAHDESTGARTVNRVNTPPPNFQRYDSSQQKTARTRNWSEQVQDINAHVSNVLGKLGNGR